MMDSIDYVDSAVWKSQNLWMHTSSSSIESGDILEAIYSSDLSKYPAILDEFHIAKGAGVEYYQSHIGQ